MPAHIGDAHRQREGREHRFVIGRIAHINHGSVEGLARHVQFARQKVSRHHQLVPGAEPAVHVNGADFGGRARRRKQGEDAIDAGGRQGRHILAEINGEIGDAVGLVGSQRATGNLRQNHLRQFIQPSPVARALLLREQMMGAHDFGGAVIAEREGAIFAHHPRHGPETGDEIAPPRRPARDRHDSEAGLLQALKGAIGLGSQPPLCRDGVINVGENAGDPCQGLRREPLQSWSLPLKHDCSKRLTRNYLCNFAY